jgi:hypothetical protein
MTTHVRCGSIFTGDTSPVRDDVTIGIGDNSRIDFVCDTSNEAIRCRHCAGLARACGAWRRD